MKTLLILRHAKSSWQEPNLIDHDRPLNPRGKRDALRMGRLLAEKNRVPDLMISSTAKRARKTAKKVAHHCGYAGQIQLLSDLYLANPPQYLESLRQVPDECESVLIVGHNPGLEELVHDLTGQQLKLPTAALVQLRLNIESWRQLQLDQRGQLIRVWRPRELEAPD